MARSESATGLFRGPPGYQTRTPWEPLPAVAASGAIVVASALVLVGSVVLLGLLGQARPEGAELTSLGVAQFATIALTLAAAGMLGGRPAGVLALRSPVGTPWIYPAALLLMLGLQIGTSLVEHSLFRGDMFADLRPFALLFKEHWLLAILVVGVGAPLAEELLFRGFLLSALARSGLGFWGGALVTTGLWTALHIGYTVLGILEVFTIGLFLSWLLWRTGSLRVAILCHALNNLLMVLLLRYVSLPS